MCYSAESSLTAFIVGGFSGLYLLCKSKNPTNRYIGLFFIAVNLMQLVEYLMWIDQDCGAINDFASRMAVPVLAIQLFTIIFGAYIFNVLYVPDTLLKSGSVIMLFYTIYILYDQFYNNNDTWCSKPNEDNSLQWANHEKIKGDISGYFYYAIFLSAPLLMKNRVKGFFLLLFGIVSWLYTRYENWNTSNSRWCYYSAFTPLFFIIVEKMKF